MIIGVGIDIIEVSRVAAAVERFGDRFLQRILLPDEIAYCRAHREPAPFIAGRFAAKEAVSKAFGTGIGAQLGWHDMEIRHRDSGAPFVVLHGNAVPLLQQRGGHSLWISLSHTDHYAAAVAILEGA
ncbi:MAG: holo-ACP synthase [Verrucomicrobiae bacterium]|nr:holo-ACP synthase [Verrucomicrobiae bacterium]MDW8308932.1 holo-ACP synthase [Verrucomicrobiales bacterium]